MVVMSIYRIKNDMPQGKVNPLVYDKTILFFLLLILRCY